MGLYLPKKISSLILIQIKLRNPPYLIQRELKNPTYVIQIKFKSAAIAQIAVRFVQMGNLEFYVGGLASPNELLGYWLWPPLEARFFLVCCRILNFKK